MPPKLNGKKKNIPSILVSKSNACVFCYSEEENEEAYGKMLRKAGINVHYFCMLFSSGLWQRGKRDQDGILGFLPADIQREQKRGLRLTCQYCRKKGATIGCVVSNCRKTFHFRCGREAGGMCQFFQEFRSYCPEHRPRQGTPSSSSDRLAFYGTAKSTCSICMLAVEARSSNDTLRSPCCRNAWFHRDCIQKYSVTAGAYFFKCPLCNNKDLFEAEMLQFGIYIPEQDAAWEQGPSAFQELLERYDRCDADQCRCPQGRQHDGAAGTRWELILCSWCGSSGTHFGCRGLKKIGKEYVCDMCAEINKNIDKTKSNSPPQAELDPEELRRQLQQRRSATLRAMRAARRGKKDEAENSDQSVPSTSNEPPRQSLQSHRARVVSPTLLGDTRLMACTPVVRIERSEKDVMVNVMDSDVEEEEKEQDDESWKGSVPQSSDTDSSARCRSPLETRAKSAWDVKRVIEKGQRKVVLLSMHNQGAKDDSDGSSVPDAPSSMMTKLQLEATIGETSQAMSDDSQDGPAPGHKPTSLQTEEGDSKEDSLSDIFEGPRKRRPGRPRKNKHRLNKQYRSDSNSLGKVEEQTKNLVTRSPSHHQTKHSSDSSSGENSADMSLPKISVKRRRFTRSSDSKSPSAEKRMERAFIGRSRSPPSAQGATMKSKVSYGQSSGEGSFPDSTPTTTNVDCDGYGESFERNFQSNSRLSTDVRGLQPSVDPSTIQHYPTLTSYHGADGGYEVNESRPPQETVQTTNCSGGDGDVVDYQKTAENLGMNFSNAQVQTDSGDFSGSSHLHSQVLEEDQQLHDHQADRSFSEKEKESSLPDDEEAMLMADAYAQFRIPPPGTRKQQPPLVPSASSDVQERPLPPLQYCPREAQHLSGMPPHPQTQHYPVPVSTAQPVHMAYANPGVYGLGPVGTQPQNNPPHPPPPSGNDIISPVQTCAYPQRATTYHQAVPGHQEGVSCVPFVAVTQGSIYEPGSQSQTQGAETQARLQPMLFQVHQLAPVVGAPPSKKVSTVRVYCPEPAAAAAPTPAVAPSHVYPVALSSTSVPNPSHMSVPPSHVYPIAPSSTSVHQSVPNPSYVSVPPSHAYPIAPSTSVDQSVPNPRHVSVPPSHAYPIAPSSTSVPNPSHVSVPPSHAYPIAPSSTAVPNPSHVSVPPSHAYPIAPSSTSVPNPSHVSVPPSHAYPITPSSTSVHQSVPNPSHVSVPPSHAYPIAPSSTSVPNPSHVSVPPSHAYPIAPSSTSVHQSVPNPSCVSVSDLSSQNRMGSSHQNLVSFGAPSGDQPVNLTRAATSTVNPLAPSLSSVMTQTSYPQPLSGPPPLIRVQAPIYSNSSRPTKHPQQRLAPGREARSSCALVPSVQAPEIPPKQSAPAPSVQPERPPRVHSPSCPLSKQQRGKQQLSKPRKDQEKAQRAQPGSQPSAQTQQKCQQVSFIQDNTSVDVLVAKDQPSKDGQSSADNEKSNKHQNASTGPGSTSEDGTVSRSRGKIWLCPPSAQAALSKDSVEMVFLSDSEDSDTDVRITGLSPAKPSMMSASPCRKHGDVSSQGGQRQHLSKQTARQTSNPHPQTRPVPYPQSQTTPTPNLQPQTTHAPDLQPQTTHAPDLQPQTTHAPNHQPQTTHAPNLQPQTTHAPNHQPQTTHAPNLQPQTTHAPISQLQTTHVPNLQPQTTHAPNPQPEKSIFPNCQPQTTHASNPLSQERTLHASVPLLRARLAPNSQTQVIQPLKSQLSATHPPSLRAQTTPTPTPQSQANDVSQERTIHASVPLLRARLAPNPQTQAIQTPQSQLSATHPPSPRAQTTHAPAPQSQAKDVSPSQPLARPAPNPQTQATQASGYVPHQSEGGLSCGGQAQSQGTPTVPNYSKPPCPVHGYHRIRRQPPPFVPAKRNADGSLLIDLTEEQNKDSDSDVEIIEHM